MDPLTSLRLAEKQAELAFVRARARLLAAELEAVNASSEQPAEDGFVYDPAWKIAGRPHLSPEGEAAILGAYDRSMRPAEVARLFKISERAALNWQRRWQHARGKSA